MTTGEVFSKLLGCSVSGYFNWKKQKRSIVVFLEKCFSKEELETYVLTGEIPAKIEFANRMYVGMELKMAYFLTNTVKNKLHLLILFTYGSLEDAPKKALELYNKNLICGEELLYFIENHSNNLSFELSLYIKENLNQNWKIFERDIAHGGINDWLPLYLEIIELSIKHGCFDKVFGKFDTAQEYKYVPNPPEMFALYQGWEDIDARYKEVLANVKKAILKNTLDSLPVWSIYDTSFTLKTLQKASF